MAIDDVVAKTAFLGGGLVLSSAAILPREYAKLVADVSAGIMMAGLLYLLAERIANIRPVEYAINRISHLYRHIQ